MHMNLKWSSEHGRELKNGVINYDYDLINLKLI